jgi:hypothetical protein
VSNVLFVFDGKLRIAASGGTTDWIISRALAGALFPKTFFIDDRVSFVLPSRFRAAGNIGQETYGTLLLVCDTTSSTLTCDTARFVFGGQLAHDLGKASWESMLPNDAQPRIRGVEGDEQSGETPAGDAGSDLIEGPDDCCVGEYHCNCVIRCTDSQGQYPCPYVDCINCWNGQCWDCRDIFGCGNRILS